MLIAAKPTPSVMPRKYLPSRVNFSLRGGAQRGRRRLPRGLGARGVSLGRATRRASGAARLRGRRVGAVVGASSSCGRRRVASPGTARPSRAERARGRRRRGRRLRSRRGTARSPRRARRGGRGARARGRRDRGCRRRCSRVRPRSSARARAARARFIPARVERRARASGAVRVAARTAWR